MRQLLLSLLLTVSVFANIPQCPTGSVQFPTKNIYKGYWPNDDFSATQPIDHNTMCTLNFGAVPARPLYVYYNLYNIDSGSISANGVEMNLGLVGTAQRFLSTPWNLDLTIKGYMQNTTNNGFEIKYSYDDQLTAPHPLFPMNVGPGEFYQITYQFLSNIFSFEIMGNTTTLQPKEILLTVLFLAYTNDTDANYRPHDQFVIYHENSPKISGHQIVYQNKGVYTLIDQNNTCYWGVTETFHPNLVVYGYKRPSNGKVVDWSRYNTKAWEAKNYQIKSDSRQIYVFLRVTTLVKGVISNVVLNGGSLKIYKNIAEVLDDGTVNGTLVATYIANQVPVAPVNYEDTSYTFLVENGSVSFDLSETAPPIPPATTVAPSTVHHPKSTTAPGIIPTTTRTSHKSNFFNSLLILLAYFSLSR